MENIQIGFISFIASYISSQSENPKTRELLVRKMMRMKSVQKIILESMSQLSALIYQEILSIEKIRSSSHQIVPKNSKLLTLAEDIKNIMNNYVFIQGKVSDMREIINSFEEHIDPPQDNAEFKEFSTSAYSFLSGIPPSQLITNADIEEISNDLWSKQVELETLLKIEVDKLKEFQNTIDNRYYYKYSFLKTKAGLKIQQLENYQIVLTERFKENINRFQMTNEDYLSAEYEKSLNEEKRISKIFDPSTIKDLQEAISKIKELLSIKLIYEKKRNKDEKLIKGLNAKLQILLDSYSELSEKNSLIESKFEEIKLNHDALLETSMSSPKSREHFRIIAKQESIRLESAKPEIDFSEFMVRKGDNTPEIRGSNTIGKGRNESIRVFRTEMKVDRLKKVPPRKKVRTATVATRTPVMQFIRQHEKQEVAIQEFKQALKSIDEGFKTTNKALTENLEELVNFKLEAEILKESRELLNRMANGYIGNKKGLEVITETASDKKKVSDEFTDISPLLQSEYQNTKIDKEIQFSSSVSTRSSQSESTFYHEIYSIWDSNKTHHKAKELSSDQIESTIIEVLRQWFRNIKEKDTQTDKEIKAPIELKMAGNELIKGLMNRSKRLTYFKPEESKSEDSIIDKIIKIPLMSEQELNEIKESEINELIYAANEYKQEFKIHTQLKGYKRLELQNIFNLWDDIINRRISEGEQDKISIYLRGLLGTKQFENEKSSVIQMIQSSKMQDFSTFTSHQIKSAKFTKSQNSKKNWKKIMSLLISNNISFFVGGLSGLENPIDKLFEAAKKIKFVKHRLKRFAPMPDSKPLDYDHFGYENSEKWIVRSTTPTLMNKTNVKSRYLNNRHIKTSAKLSRPLKKVIQYRDLQISPLKNY